MTGSQTRTFRRLRHRVLAAVAALAAGVPLARAEDDNAREFFEKKIRPVLVAHCYECHSTAATDLKGDLLLDSRASIRRGGESGPAVVPGNPDQSLLLQALRHESFEMPPTGKLPESVISDFAHWIKGGAFDPRDAPAEAAAVSNELWETQFANRSRLWSYQPIADPPVPDARAGDRSSGAMIDRFILEKLNEHGLAPAVQADRATLARRLSFALVGLPPTEKQIESLARDDSDANWESLVDEMLASPHFGERWARHWMDVVRYTDTYGYEWDIPAKGAWRYRDYLIRAFNNDVGFDQLVREHIAGDLLDPPRINAELQINESLIGPMFFQMGENRHGDSAEFDGVHQEMLDNKIDAFSKALQATTISCARCHDHKLDPVAQREYYALAGVFMSSRWITNTLDTRERNRDGLAMLAELKTQLRPLLASAWLEESGRFAEHLRGALKRHAPEASREENGEPPPGPTGTWMRLQAKADAAEPLIEDPFSPWHHLVKAAQAGRPVAASWRELGARYAEEARNRKQQNAAHFITAVDFRNGIPDGWSVDGVGLQEIVPCGDFTVALEGDAVVGRILPGGLFTNALSPRLNGAVRTPYLNEYDTGHISFECCGGDFAAHRTVVDNAFLTERQQYLDSEHPAWTLLETHQSMQGRHVYIEFATKTSNPNFPPRVGLGGACTQEQVADPRSWFGITRVVLHNAGHTPLDELDRFLSLFDGPCPETLDDAGQRYAQWFQTAVRAWHDGAPTGDDVRLINWLLDQDILTNRMPADTARGLARIVTEYRNAEQSLAVPQTVNGMADVDPGYDYRLNVRGEYSQFGEAVPRGWLRLLNNLPGNVDAYGGSLASAGPAKLAAAAFDVPGSGRLELAAKIACPDNPLTARVFVNRVWHWLYGSGLVSTPDDFGHLGDRPSHPELLDWLACRFIEDGWSVKSLIRRIVLSRTWQQSASTTEQARAVDPRNRLLHHYPTRRLEAEALRDAILAVSGRLDPRLYGPPIDPYRSQEDPQKRLFSGPLDGNGRRSVYTKITVMEPPRLLALFNQPNPKIPTGKRDVTNSPVQSLALLNDPFVIAQAQFWAENLLERREEALDTRIGRMFLAGFGRMPTADELVRWKRAVADLADLHGVAENHVMENVPVWQDMAHLVINCKEFVYLR